MKQHTLPLILLATVLATPVLAEKLPKTAAPISASELTSLYEGKSSDWSRIRAYFAPGGKYLVVSKTSSFHTEGSWKVQGNELCAVINWLDDKTKEPKSATDCWTWFKDGKKYFTLHSRESDKVNGYYSQELSKLSKGDAVSPIIAKLK